MANADPNNVPVLLAMATGFMMLHQVGGSEGNGEREARLAKRREQD